jgi:hypothetical protein
MNKNVLNEISQMKFLFGYKPGKVLSEQELPEVDVEMNEMDKEMDEVDFSDVFDNEEDVDVMDFSDIEMDSPDVAPAPTREKERTREKEKETEKPFRPQRPDRENLPAYDPHPQGRRKMRDMDLERPMRRRMGDVDENIYEIEIDGSIEELFKK